jgi:hypothetical protein
MSIRALGGGALDGDRLVRFVYLDESGIGNAKDDRFVVTAGVVVHADVHWKPLEQYLLDLVDEMVRPEDRHGFYFHGTDLFHGTKKTHRDIYPKELRWDVLRRLCFAVEKFHLPVVVGFVDRADPLLLGANPNDTVIRAQTVTAGLCLLQVEEYMQEFAYTGELATMVYENNNQCRTHIKRLQKQFLDRQAAPALRTFETHMLGKPYSTQHLPLKRVVDTANFVEKEDCCILQIADACAFVIKRHLMGKSDSEQFVAPIFNQLASVEMKLRLQGITIPIENPTPPARRFYLPQFPFWSKKQK